MARDAFSQMIDDALVFYAELDANNSKAWFDTQRARHKSQIKDPADVFVGFMAEELSKTTGKPHKGKLFRANRDVRFSKDKRPYNTHLHMSWSDPAGDGPSFFFGASPEYVIAGYGLMGLAGDGLTRFRRLVDTHGDAIKTQIAQCNATVSDFGPDPLKRVSKPYDADHPHGDLLKRKSFTITTDLKAALAPQDAILFDLVRAAFDRFTPLHRLIDAEM